MLVEWGRGSNGTLVEDVDVVNKLVLIRDSIGGTKENLQWVTINKINFVRDIGTYEHTVNLINMFNDSCM